MRGINNENTFIVVDSRGEAVAEVSDGFAKNHPLKPPFTYKRPGEYLAALNGRILKGGFEPR